MDDPHWKVKATIKTDFGCHAPRWSVLYLKSEDIGALKEIFPDGQADEMNFVLFSTSGVSGSYTTLEEIEESINKYGDEIPSENEDLPEDYCRPGLTFVLIQPRIIGIRYGNVRVTKEDIPYLKKLRQTSWEAVARIGKGSK